jgi:hypothetical protein
MKLTHLIGAAVVTFGLSAGAQAGSLLGHGDAIAGQPSSIAVPAGGGRGPVGHAGPSFSPGGGHFNQGGAHMNRGGMQFKQGGPHLNLGGTHFKHSVVPRSGARRLGGQWNTNHLSGRHLGRHHNRHWRRHGVWWGGPDYYWGGGSCYGNCLAAGYGSGYCSLHADEFCW